MWIRRQIQSVVCSQSARMELIMYYRRVNLNPYEFDTNIDYFAITMNHFHGHQMKNGKSEILKMQFEKITP